MRKVDFDKNILRNEDGSVIKIYRGFHADEDEIESHLSNPFITSDHALPTFTGSPHAASVYAISPNNPDHDTGDSNGVIGIYEIAMKKPLLIDQDRFLDFVVIRDVLGAEIESEQWKSLFEETMEKGVWNHDGCETYLEEFNSMEKEEQDMAYAESYWLCDDERFISVLKSLGYDGIASLGVCHLDKDVESEMETSRHYDTRICACTEYRPFNKDQVRYESNKEPVYPQEIKKRERTWEAEMGM